MPRKYLTTTRPVKAGIGYAEIHPFHIGLLSG